MDAEEIGQYDGSLYCNVFPGFCSWFAPPLSERGQKRDSSKWVLLYTYGHLDKDLCIFPGAYSPVALLRRTALSARFAGLFHMPLSQLAKRHFFMS